MTDTTTAAAADANEGTVEGTAKDPVTAIADGASEGAAKGSVTLAAASARPDAQERFLQWLYTSVPGRA